MKIEFVGFYPSKVRKNYKSPLGTCHIYLCEPYNMDIRGILVSKRGKSTYFLLPVSKGYDEDTGNHVFYPIVAFTDLKIKEEILKFLQSEGMKEVEKVLSLEKANSLENKKS